MSKKICGVSALLVAVGLVVAAAATRPALSQAADEKKQSWMEWGESYSKDKPVPGGTYRAAAAAYIGLMNPNHWPVNDWVTIGLFYEKLVYTDGKYRPTVPWLAESWNYDDPKTVTMKLKKGVTFHDGSPFNAESVKYQIDWIMDKANGAWSRSWLEPVESIEVVDEHTVRWRFKQPWAGFLGIIANVPGYVIGTQPLKKDGPKALDTNPVGTGPYVLGEASPGNYLKLKRNPNWWFGKSIGKPEMPYFDELIVNVIPDPSVQLANLRAGKIDFMALSTSQYDAVKNDPDVKVYTYPGNHVAAARFNTTDGPCKDIRVRQAISHAIDRQAIVVGTQFGLGKVASVMYPEDHWCHNPELKPVPFDPEKSKKLLAEAGYGKGLKVKGYWSPALQTVAEAIKAMLADVGVDWELEILDSAAISDRMKNVEYDVGQGGWVWIFDPDLMATGLYHPDGGFNYGRSDNKKAIELIEAGRKEVDFDKRTKIYFELEKVLYDNYEDAWLYWPITAVAYRKNVMGFNLDMFLKDREAYAWSHPLWFKEGKP